MMRVDVSVGLEVCLGKGLDVSVGLEVGLGKGLDVSVGLEVGLGDESGCECRFGGMPG